MTKNAYIEQLYLLDYDALMQVYLSAVKRLTDADMRYVVCFLTSMDENDIHLIFNVELPSVYSAHYRIRKKFRDEDLLRWCL
jgi:hypothetical protein